MRVRQGLHLFARQPASGTWNRTVYLQNNLKRDQAPELCDMS